MKIPRRVWVVCGAFCCARLLVSFFTMAAAGFDAIRWWKIGAPTPIQWIDYPLSVLYSDGSIEPASLAGSVASAAWWFLLPLTVWLAVWGRGDGVLSFRIARTIALCLLIAVLAWWYYASISLALLVAHTYGPWGRGVRSYYTFRYLTDVLVAAVVSVPFAIVVARCYGRYWLLAATVLVVFYDQGHLRESDYYSGPDWLYKLIDGVVHLRISIDTVIPLGIPVVILPALTWLALRMPSNYRLDRTGGLVASVRPGRGR